MRGLLFASAMLLATPALAQDVMVKQADWNKLAVILNEDTPQKWAAPVLRWAQEIIRKDAEAKKAEAPKPEAPKK